MHRNIATLLQFIPCQSNVKWIHMTRTLQFLQRFGLERVRLIHIVVKLSAYRELSWLFRMISSYCWLRQSSYDIAYEPFLIWNTAYNIIHHFSSDDWSGLSDESVGMKDYQDWNHFEWGINIVAMIFCVPRKLFKSQERLSIASAGGYTNVWVKTRANEWLVETWIGST